MNQVLQEYTFTYFIQFVVFEIFKTEHVLSFDSLIFVLLTLNSNILKIKN